MKIYKKAVCYLFIICAMIGISGCQAREAFLEEPAITVTPALDRQIKLIDTGPSQGGSITLPLSEIDELNPYQTKNPGAIQIAPLLYDFLYIWAQENIAKPWLVTDCEHQSFSVWKFTLRENVRFHHGPELTAYDVRHTLRVLENSNSPFFYSGIFDNIQEIVIISSSQFEIKLKEPDASFTKKLVFPVLSQTIESDRDELISGTGPYELERIDPFTIHLVRNEQWWQNDLPWFDSVQFKVMPENKMVDSFQNNETDITFIKNIDFSKLQHRTDIHYRVYPDWEGSFLCVNPNSILGQENRKDALFRYVASRMRDFGYEQVQYFAKEDGRPYTVTEFREDLIESGLIWNEGRKTFTEKNRALQTLSIFVADQDMQNRHIAEFIVNILSDAGVRAELETTGTQQVMRAIQKGSYDLAMITEELKPWESFTDTAKRKQRALGLGNESSIVFPFYRNQRAMLFKGHIRGEKQPNFWNPYQGFHEWYVPDFSDKVQEK